MNWASGGRTQVFVNGVIPTWFVYGQESLVAQGDDTSFFQLLLPIILHILNSYLLLTLVGWSAMLCYSRSARHTAHRRLNHVARRYQPAIQESCRG